MANKVKNTSPCIDPHRICCGTKNSHDIYKGTSFNFGEWKPCHHYYHDEYIIDFVSYKDCISDTTGIWVCNKNHVSSASVNNPGLDDTWTYVMGESCSGSDVGGSNLFYIPSIDEEGNLVFTLSTKPNGNEIKLNVGEDDIHYGEDEPYDKSKIWFDPSDISKYDVNSLDIVYNAYVLSGGLLDKSSFSIALKNIK